MGIKILNYFLNPYEEGYTIEKTLVFALLFIVLAFVIYKLLKKLKIKIDRRLVIATLPFVFFGSSLRVIVDSGIIKNQTLKILLTTPNIYIIISMLILSLLYFSISLQKKKIAKYHKIMFSIGSTLFILSLTLLRFVNFYGALLIFLFIFPWLLFCLFFKKWSFENRFALFFQMLDANATFVSLNFFPLYKEQHVIPNFIISLFGPYSFVIVKFITVFSILFLIDKFSKDKELNNYVKIIIGFLGAATGMRDSLRLIALV
jgi:uncharacterized membrane protein